MLRRIFSAKQVALRLTFASSAHAHLFLPFTATSATSKPAPLHSLRTCPLRFPATTSSCPRPLSEGEVIVIVNLHSFISNLRAFRQNNPSFWGNHESHRRHCIHSFCGNHACSSREPRRRRRAAALRLFRRVFPHRTPVGREAPRHSQPGEPPQLHAASLGAPAPRRLALRQSQRRMDRRKIQGVWSRYSHRTV